MIETGRYRRPKIPRNERFCPFCPGFVESETHFLLHCDKYAKLRESYINKHVNLLRSRHPFQNDLTTIINLLNPDNISLAKDVSNYIENSLAIRKNNI